MSTLSKEYVSSSDADSDSEVESNTPDHTPVVEDLTFTVPPNFTKLKPSTNVFPKDLKNKEVWLIKAPKGFQLKDLKTLPVSFNPLADSESFVNAGIKYKVHEDLTNLASLDKKKSKKDSKYSILTPSNSSNSYKFNRKLRVDRVYNVVESVEIPSIDYTKVVTPREDVRVVKGLMPQHFATGYNKSEGDVCTDDEAELPKQKKQKMEADGVKVKKDKKEKKEKKEKKDKKDKKKEKKEKK